MSLIRIFLVAWMFDHPSTEAPRPVASPHLPHIYDLDSGRFIDNSKNHSGNDDCLFLCSQATSLKYELYRNKAHVEEVSETSGISTSAVSGALQTEDVFGTNVHCECGSNVRQPHVLKRAASSIDKLTKHVPFRKKYVKKKYSVKEMPLFSELKEKLFMSKNQYSNTFLSIPEKSSFNDDLFPERLEQDMIEYTENSSVQAKDLSSLTKDVRNLEESFSKTNVSLIKVVLEDEGLLQVPPIYLSPGPKSVTSVPALGEYTDSSNGESLQTTPIRGVEMMNRSDVYAVFRSRYPVEQWKAMGYFTEHYLELINRHWLQFPPPYPRSHYILAALYTIIMTVGVTGNFLVIFMFLRCRSLRTPANVLVMNLALSDFFLLAKMPVFIFNCFYYGPALGEIGCEVYGFLGGLTGTVSIMTLAAIALDRYYVIVYPLDPLRRTTRQRARLCVAFVWCYGCTFASMPLTNYGFSRYVPEGYLTSCSFDYLNQSFHSRVFILVFFFAAWVVPFSVITFCYIRIYRVVISGSSGASSRRGQEEEKRKTEIRLAGVIVGVIGLWFLSWTPYAIVALLGVSGNAHLLSPLSSMIPALFCKTASCIDPYVYAVTHPRFRREFRRFFCNRQIRKRFDAGKTQCWKTESSQIPGMMIGIRHPRVDYSLSEEDVEEMVVMVDNNRSQKTTYFPASTIAPEEHNLCEITFPPDSRTSEILQHPSWFMPPQPRRDRSTSLKLTSKVSKNMCSDPTSV